MLARVTILYQRSFTIHPGLPEGVERSWRRRWAQSLAGLPGEVVLLKVGEEAVARRSVELPVVLVDHPTPWLEDVTAVGPQRDVLAASVVWRSPACSRVVGARVGELDGGARPAVHRMEEADAVSSHAPVKPMRSDACTYGC